MIFPKKLHWNMIFLVSPRKMIFLFPENTILFFSRKMKGDLSQKKKKKKKTWKYDIFFKCSAKMVFPKKLHWNMIFLISWGKMAFLFPEYVIFLYVGKGSVSFFSQIWNYHSVKKSKMTFSRKTHLKMTFPALLKILMIFILEKMILTFSVLSWRPF